MDNEGQQSSYCPGARQWNILALLCECDLGMIFPIDGEILPTDGTGCMDLLCKLSLHRADAIWPITAAID